MTCQVRVSYLEIYNEIGYDLLDPDREVKALEDLTRVSQTPKPGSQAPEVKEWDASCLLCVEGPGGGANSVLPSFAASLACRRCLCVRTRRARSRTATCASTT